MYKKNLSFHYVLLYAIGPLIYMSIALIPKYCNSEQIKKEGWEIQVFKKRKKKLCTVAVS